MPPADNGHYLTQAARHRAADARRRALAAIKNLAAEGQQVTPTTVARHAGVSRQWLYTYDEAMDAIRSARPAAAGRGALPMLPATVASLRRRLEATTDDNKRLRQRVADLEAQLAAVYGELRARNR